MGPIYSNLLNNFGIATQSIAVYMVRILSTKKLLLDNKIAGESHQSGHV
jgi:hypothetical protein